VNDLVLVERDGAVGVVTLNRPGRRNALSTPLLAALADALASLDADTGVRAIVLQGEGPAFGAGADVDELAAISPAEVVTGARRAHWNALQVRPTPIVAAVHGWALGAGCELALLCDIVVAAEDARFGLPETSLGLMPGAGGTQRLVRAVGKAVALDVIIAGRVLRGPEAAACGLAARCVPAEALRSTAREIAQAIAKRPALAVALAREAVARAQDVALAQGLAAERDAFALLRSTPDAAEGIDAVREKRDARFPSH
jgi:enoyl-CoA hydratase